MHTSFSPCPHDSTCVQPPPAECIDIDQDVGADGVVTWSSVPDEKKLNIRDLAVRYVSSGAMHQPDEIQAPLEAAFLNGALDTELVANTPLSRWPIMVKMSANAALEEIAQKRHEEKQAAVLAAEEAIKSAASAAQSQVRDSASTCLNNLSMISMSQPVHVIICYCKHFQTHDLCAGGFDHVVTNICKPRSRS